MDLNYKTSIDEYQNQIIKQCMSHLFKQFPDNNLQFLIQSGAKGKQPEDGIESESGPIRLVDRPIHSNVLRSVS
jgi:hypothetical protein